VALLARSPGATKVLGVYLAATPAERVLVGHLFRDSTGLVRFVVDEAYVALGRERPTLSASWLGANDEEVSRARLRANDEPLKIGRDGRLPPWFSNLLPEGALRALVLTQMQTGEHDEFEILTRLGADLPGAVQVVPDHSPFPARRRAAPARHAVDAAARGMKIKFSLAGVQLKFSMLDKDRRLTMPASGEGGEVIVKLPSARHPSLPEAEFVGMTLAKAAGVETADCELRPATAVIGLPASLLADGPHVFVTRRFDRRAPHTRIHVEDFAQVFGATGEGKSHKTNQETCLKLLTRFAVDGAGAVLEGVRRVVVNILLGNGDAHLKNWSFIYSDTVHPSLSPAYDIVPTALYGDNTLALKFYGTHQAQGIDHRAFERAAKYLGLAAKAITDEVERTITCAAERWPALWEKFRAELPLPTSFGPVLADRWATLALTRGRANPFA